MKETARQILRNTRVVLTGTTQTDLETPLFAINWFDTRVAWIYHLYNRLAAVRVHRIGGKVFFKGRVSEQVGGNPDLGRSYLLIVNYPSAERFLDLAADRVFQALSVLRISAVQNFSFVLNRRIGGTQLLESNTQPWDKKEHYALLIFKNESEDEGLSTALEAMATAAGITTHFSSRKCVSVATESREGEHSPASYVTDRVVLFSSDSKQALASFLSSPELENFLEETEEFFSAHIDRIL